MDALSTWAKENFDLITLLVGFAGVVVAVISLIYELRKKKALKAAAKKQPNELSNDQLDDVNGGIIITNPR